MPSKPKLTIEEQINHMKDLGIQFSIVTEEEAKEFLLYSTYYFKIKAYAKNYDKYLSGDHAGEYINLDFAYLKELSTLDARLRKFIIKTTLDIEHFLKVQLLRHLERNKKEDGYGIVQKYLNAYPNIKSEIENRKTNSTCCDLIDKYSNEFALWNIVEVLTFRQFIDLYEMYFSLYPFRHSLKNCLKPIQFLRNAAAHNNCLINKLNGPYAHHITVNRAVENYVASIPTIKSTSRNKKMANPVIHDFVTMLFVYDRVVTSKKTKEHMKKDLKELIDRFATHKDYFRSNATILSHIEFLEKLVDFFINS